MVPPALAGPEMPAVRGWEKKGLLTAAVLGLGFMAVAYAGTFATLARAWSHNPNYSHGFLIPPISIFLAWRLRRELAALPSEPSVWGLLLLIPAAVLQVVGTRGDVAMFQAYSFIGLLTGLVWTWFGFRVLRLLLFPLAYLSFMAPTFPVFINELSFRLKTIATFGSVWLAQHFGVAVTREGMELHFPSGTLTVEAACSGLNSLIALMAMGALIAYFCRGALWRRWVFFLFSVPVALAANVVRLTSLCLCAALTDTTRAAGLFHDIGGFVLFGAALLAMALLKKVLRC
jgi:exosortase